MLYMKKESKNKQSIIIVMEQGKIVRLNGISFLFVFQPS